MLAPGGDRDSIKAAIAAGANAVYFGIDRFNARNRAENIAIKDVPEIIYLAHKYKCKVFLTLNIIILDSEINAFKNVLNKIKDTEIDAFIISDLGMFYLLKRYFNSIKVHASTQMTTHNRGQIEFLKKMNVTRVNLSRELNKEEVKFLTDYSHSLNIQTEMFVHGSQCICFSGICYMSSMQKGTSGNRGRCSQPCRDRYLSEITKNNYPLNLKDSSLFLSIDEILKTGVDSLKVEGRIKKFHYVYSVIKEWRKQIDKFYSNKKMKNNLDNLRLIFNRDFSDSYFKNNLDKEMFINNPMDNSAKHLSQLMGIDISEAKKELYDKRTDIINRVKDKINLLNVDGFKSISKKNHLSPVEVPIFKKPHRKPIKSTLSVLISSKEDIEHLNSIDSTKVFFEVPEVLQNKENDIIELLNKNKQIFPWFPSILIGDDYTKAINILKQTTPEIIVTNNTGIAMAAIKENINWIAGPNLNIVNSYSLLCLKEEYHCSGAFISNELSRKQIDRLNSPENFKLFYRLYHPIELMTSRVCLFLNTCGCKKDKMDSDCLSKCSKQTTIKNQNDEVFYITKKEGSYNKIYNSHDFLNTEINKDIPDLISSFMIDLRDIKTATTLNTSKEDIIRYFKEYLERKDEASNILHHKFNKTTNSQYIKGI